MDRIKNIAQDCMSLAAGIIFAAAALFLAGVFLGLCWRVVEAGWGILR